jgi:hypothetical protein
LKFTAILIISATSTAVAPTPPTAALLTLKPTWNFDSAPSVKQHTLLLSAPLGAEHFNIPECITNISDEYRATYILSNSARGKAAIVSSHLLK